MDKNVRKILGGMSTAGLILAGSLPLMAESGWTQCSVGTRAKSAKAKDNSAAKKAGDSAKAKAAAAKAKTADKAKTEPVKAK